METEIEAKFPDVDASKLRAKLVEKGAELVQPEILMRRRTYDDRAGWLQKANGWVRVRNEGDKITLSYKQLNERTLHGMKEINLVVSDFDKTCAFLEAIGMIEKSYQETKREKWVHQDVEVTIDTWPWIPTFAELEGLSEQAVQGAAEDLGFDWKRAMHGSVETVYQMHYDVTEDEVAHWKSIIFVDVPEWLLEKRLK